MLDATNRVFRQTMRPAVTELTYAPEDELICGLGAREDDPPVMVHLLRGSDIRDALEGSASENFDTAAPEDAHSGIIIPLRNMINEAYALDIGRKIRAQQRQAMKDGKFIGARTPYGYLKAEDDCHQLIIDPVAAVVVQRMFRWASEGAGLNTIAVRLNEAGVLTPSHYKKMQGKITHENLLGSGK